MADFKTAHKIVMAIEGGYANDPDDNGGETYKGIARNFFPGWEGWKIVDLYKRSGIAHSMLDSLLDEANELQGYVLDFYKKSFWDGLNLDGVKDQKIATELYDTGVNMGTGIAALFLQQALNLNNRNATDYPDITEDKKIGPQTLKFCNEHKRPNELYKTLNVLQGARYIEIIKSSPRKEKFWRSWLSRVSFNY